MNTWHNFGHNEEYLLPPLLFCEQAEEGYDEDMHTPRSRRSRWRSAQLQAGGPPLCPAMEDREWHPVSLDNYGETGFQKFQKIPKTTMPPTVPVEERTAARGGGGACRRAASNVGLTRNQTSEVDNVSL